MLKTLAQKLPKITKTFFNIFYINYLFTFLYYCTNQLIFALEFIFGTKFKLIGSNRNAISKSALQIRVQYHFNKQQTNYINKGKQNKYIDLDFMQGGKGTKLRFY